MSVGPVPTWTSSCTSGRPEARSTRVTVPAVAFMIHSASEVAAIASLCGIARFVCRRRLPERASISASAPLPPMAQTRPLAVATPNGCWTAGTAASCTVP